MGDDTKVFLGSAELGAVVALLGRMPEPEEYLAIYRERIGPIKKSLYKYLQFDEMADYICGGGNG